MAAARVRTETLQRWWCAKYNRPRKDPLLSEYTPEELMIEYLEDVIAADPSQEFPQDLRESGRYAFRTGDDLVDRWQEDAALGNEIDFADAFKADPAALRQFEAIREASRLRGRAQQAVADLDDVHVDLKGG